MTAPSAPTVVGTNPMICKARGSHQKNRSPLYLSLHSHIHHASTTVTESAPSMRPMKMETQVMPKTAGITFITAAVKSMMGHNVKRGRVTEAEAEKGDVDIIIRAQWMRVWEVERGNIGTITPIGITERAMEWSVLGARANGGPGRRMAHGQEQGRERGAQGGRMEEMEGGGDIGLGPVKLSLRWKERSNKGMEKRRASCTAIGRPTRNLRTQKSADLCIFLTHY